MKTYWVIGLLMAAGLQVHAASCNVNVYIVTNIRTPGNLILDARLQATAMFRQIGVPVRIHSDVPVRNPSDSCGAPIVIQLEATTRYPVPADALAYATPYQNSGACIHVFLDRVLNRHRDQFFTNSLLAHVMVHEITHVLQQIDRHSQEGVMKAHWSNDDYQHMERQSLRFAAEDVGLIRAGLAKRTTQTVATR